MDEQKELPLGIQSFPELIEKNLLYIDKTSYIHRLVTKGKLYFLSRPRRFGKSVLVSTLEALFRGRRELFEGLYIADRWNWQPRPVIRLDFLGVKTHNLEVMEHALNRRLDTQAEGYGVTLSARDSNERLRELILQLSKEGRVVVLVDEYDKPILDQINNQEQAELNRNFLATFFAVLKSLEEKLDFLLMTGVSKFSKVSLFSELNNLEDLTLQKDYAGITGYTQEEMDTCFEPYLAQEIDGFSGRALRDELRTWYNGYSWDGETRIYNPVSVLSTLKQKQFYPYWFSTGTPRFLIELLREKKVELQKLPGLEIGAVAMEGYEPASIDPIALLFQTGYMTIKSIETTRVGRVYKMDYPNHEVQYSFMTYLLADALEKQPSVMGPIALNLGNELENNNIDAFCEGLSGLFASIPYNVFIPEREAYYQTVIYLVLSLLGTEATYEVQTSKGRIDAVLETSHAFYIVEFKLGTAEEAIEQIISRQYAAAYRHRNKSIKLLGIGINPEKSNLESWLCRDY